MVLGSNSRLYVGVSLIVDHDRSSKERKSGWAGDVGTQYKIWECHGWFVTSVMLHGLDGTMKSNVQAENAQLWASSRSCLVAWNIVILALMDGSSFRHFFLCLSSSIAVAFSPKSHHPSV